MLKCQSIHIWNGRHIGWTLLVHLEFQNDYNQPTVLDQHTNSICHVIVYILLNLINVITQDVMLLYIYTVGLDQHNISRCHVIVYIQFGWINIITQDVMLLYTYCWTGSTYKLKMSCYCIYKAGLDQHNNSICHVIVYILLDWINIITQDVMLLDIYSWTGST